MLPPSGGTTVLVSEKEFHHFFHLAPPPLSLSRGRSLSSEMKTSFAGSLCSSTGSAAFGLRGQSESPRREIPRS